MPTLTSPRTQKRPRLEIIPFIDIMFFLLATFMMVSINMIMNKGIDVNLPSASSATEQKDNPDHLTISISREGLLYLGKETVSAEELLVRMRSFKREKPEGRMILQADGEAPFRMVMKVMDEARLNGLKKFFIRTRQHESGTEAPLKQEA